MKMWRMSKATACKTAFLAWSRVLPRSLYSDIKFKKGPFIRRAALAGGSAKVQLDIHKIYNGLLSTPQSHPLQSTLIDHSSLLCQPWM